jgi:hypothetical protein
MTEEKTPRPTPGSVEKRSFADVAGGVAAAAAVAQLGLSAYQGRRPKGDPPPPTAKAPEQPKGGE